MVIRLLHVLSKHKACTRLADLTGFTPLNLPVWAAIRPNGKSGSSTVGKGLSEEQSKLSALFECYELTCAERLEPQQSCDLPLCYQRYMFHPSSAMSEKAMVCIGRSLLDDKEVMIPFGYLSMDTTRKQEAYLCSTIGTGAGSTAEMALRSALREFMERYSIISAQSFPAMKWRISSGGLDGTGESSLGSLVELCLTKNFEILVQDYTQIKGWPCFCIRLFCRQAHGLLVGNGYGCDRDPGKALTQAILEAHQGICVGVSGIRDDMFKATYLTSRSDHCKWIRDLQNNYSAISLDRILEDCSKQALVDQATLTDRLVLFEYPKLDPAIPYACVKLLLPLQ